MINRITMLFILVLMMGVTAGCGSSGDPSSPQQPPIDIPNSLDASATPHLTWLWGYYDIEIDIENKTVSASLNRHVMFTANVVTFLNANPAKFEFDINETPITPQYVDVDIDVSITHPIAGAEKFNGYDVRCVFISNGSSQFSGGGPKYSDLSSDPFMLDDPDGGGGGPDGYTRWYNPTEFTVPGLFGYTHGNKAIYTEFDKAANVNPYKYFADGLGAQDDLWQWLSDNPDSHGVFSSGTKNSRNFYLRFPLAAKVRFAYAILADWGGGAPENHPSNAPEAIACDLADNSILFYVDETHNGGLLDLDFSLYNWSEPPVSIMINSTVLASTYDLTPSEMIPIGGGVNYSTWHVEILVDNVTGLETAESWILASYNDHDYSNSFGVPNSVDDPLIAFFRFPLTISPQAPECSEPPQILTLDLPDAYVGLEYNVQIDATGGEGTLHWTLGPATTLPAGLELSDNGIISGIPEPGAGGQYLGLDIVVKDSCLAGAQSDLELMDLRVYEPVITVTSPNGGESWDIGSDNEITWTSSDVPGLVDLIYSKDNFNMDFQTIAMGEANDGSFIWTDIPIDPSDNTRVRVQSSYQPFFYDDSDGDFSISGAYINVNSPNGGETLTSTGSFEITWESLYIPLAINIWYSKDGFVDDKNLITQFELNDGSFIWSPIPIDLSETVTIMVEESVDGMIFDTSDDVFTIQ